MPVFFTLAWCRCHGLWRQEPGEYPGTGFGQRLPATGPKRRIAQRELRQIGQIFN